MASARAYVESVRWQEAKTRDHQYTLFDWRPDLGQLFDEFVDLIWGRGVVKPWPPPPRRAVYRHTYYQLDGWDYFVMTSGPEALSSLINRAPSGWDGEPAAQEDQQLGLDLSEPTA